MKEEFSKKTMEYKGREKGVPKNISVNKGMGLVKRQKLPIYCLRLG